MNFRLVQKLGMLEITQQILSLNPEFKVRVKIGPGRQATKNGNQMIVFFMTAQNM